MANRLTRIYTRTGDSGATGLADGSRVPKDAPRIQVIGTVDELNSISGLLLCEDLPPHVRACLSDVQHDLFDLGGELSMPGHTIVSEAHSKRLEDALDTFNAGLPPLKDFILPGGSRAAALAHVARTVCRRAERLMVELAAQPGEVVAEPALKYVNRLSDFLFVAGRYANDRGKSDVLWVPGQNR
jgi:cob(I)alamin adenosyltransferase